MADPTEDLFDGLDRPRPLPAPLRDRLEQQLLAATGAPETVPLGAELDERLRTTLTDPIAAALAGVDAPRALSPQLHAAMTGRLVRRRSARRFLGAAAAVVLVGALAVVLAQSGSGGHRPGSAPEAGAAGALASPPSGGGTAVGGAGVDTTGGAGGGSVLSSRRQVPSPTSGSVAAGAPAIAAQDSVAVRGATPDAGPVAGGTTVTLSGRGLSTATQVYFGKRLASSYTVVSDTTIRAVTPMAAGPGALDVVVALRSGASYRLPSGFSYLPRPVVASMSPATGPTSGGTWVTISGTALSRVTAVRFGGTDATRIDVVSDGELRAQSPQHPAGPVDVTVTTPGGTSATNTGDRYTYLP